ncbi:hypothetical protein [Massilia aerilata]|uniref:Uncharacterized protein n=1 Tax=Massilia aerilata TaxID=453817 RepID=A0ABW0RYQ7_9BURK
MDIVPSILSAIYSAAVHIKEVGPLTVEALFAAVDFGSGSAPKSRLKYAFEINWLHQTQDGKIDLTESTKQHFAPKHQSAPYVGQKAPAAYRGNIYATNGLSAKYRLNSRGTRDDIPAWSIREKPSFHTKA